MKNEFIESLNMLLSLSNNKVTDGVLTSYVNKAKNDLMYTTQFDKDTKASIDKKLDEIKKISDYNFRKKNIAEIIQIYHSHNKGS